MNLIVSTTLVCVSMTPRGWPVLPDVYWMNARSSGAASCSRGGVPSASRSFGSRIVRMFGASESDGLPLSQVVAGSGAAKAGLQDGDVLVRLGDRPINAFDDLLAALRDRKPGDEVRLLYLRDGIDHETLATLGSRP